VFTHAADPLEADDWLKPEDAHYLSV
jgi:hypothetical protein